MTGTQLSSADLDMRRRRLLYRAWHRGTRELDLMIGGFADAHLAQMNDADLADFERLLEQQDPDMMAWLMGDSLAPVEQQTKVFNAIRSFHSHQAPIHK